MDLKTLTQNLPGYVRLVFLVVLRLFLNMEAVFISSQTVWVFHPDLGRLVANNNWQLLEVIKSVAV